MWPSRSRYVLLLGAIVVSCLTGWLYLTPVKTLRGSHMKFSYTGVPDEACDDRLTKPINTQPHVIPNTVHYVWLLRDPEEFRLNFKAFVSIYSALRYWNPRRIYIHTDASPEVLARAHSHGDEWTKRILSIPAVVPSIIKPPQTTRQGVEIKSLEHKSDFVRLTALKQFGGVYLDMDAVPLRDIHGLRHSGFANIVSGQTAMAPVFEGEINNGILMAIPNSKFV
jgi:mannosyltransferase OCH1-like enzyme